MIFLLNIIIVNIIFPNKYLFFHSQRERDHRGEELAYVYVTYKDWD